MTPSPITSSSSTSPPPSSQSTNTHPIPIKQRHRSSFSQVRKRRPSDVDRDRATSLRLAALSLSPPGVGPNHSHAHTHNHTHNHAALSKSVPAGSDDASTAGVGGKKKGAIFKCETCAKAYRHPSCLVKHRWEHSPHWREASKFLLSKHQQVQLLEAAAILSHLSPTKTGGGTSLPEDRSLWPSYLSGGLLPMPTTNVRSTSSLTNPGITTTAPTPTTATSKVGREDNMSTSDDESDSDQAPSDAINIGNGNSSSGTYAKSVPTPIPIPIPGLGGLPLTQFRPGLLGHPNPNPNAGATPASSLPIPPRNGGGYEMGNSWGGQFNSFGAALSSSHSHSYSYHPTNPYGHSYSSSNGIGPFSSSGSISNGAGGGFSFDSDVGLGGGRDGRGWSLPRSSVRSGGEESEDERDDEEVDVLGDLDVGTAVNGDGGKKKEDIVVGKDAGDWDMEMEMDI